jgi:plasmid stabilization system protein ParE
MNVVWSARAQADVGRLYHFLARNDLAAADAVLDLLVAGPDSLMDFPRLGPRLSQFDPREIRELRVHRYLLRYEVSGNEIRILRAFHAREDR